MSDARISAYKLECLICNALVLFFFASIVGVVVSDGAPRVAAILAIFN